MNVPLNPEQERIIREKIESGHYRSPDEVIDAALLLLDERDRKLEALRRDVQEGLASGTAGPFDEEAEKRIIARGQERLNQRHHPS